MTQDEILSLLSRLTVRFNTYLTLSNTTETKKNKVTLETKRYLYWSPPPQRYYYLRGFKELTLWLPTIIPHKFCEYLKKNSWGPLTHMCSGSSSKSSPFEPLVFPPSPIDFYDWYHRYRPLYSELSSLNPVRKISKLHTPHAPPTPVETIQNAFIGVW